MNERVWVTQHSCANADAGNSAQGRPVTEKDARQHPPSTHSSEHTTEISDEEDEHNNDAHPRNV